MIQIAQYENLFSIYITLMAIVPACVLGFLGRRSKVLNIICSIAIILSVLGIHSMQIVQFFAFLLFELLLVYFFLYFRKKCSSEVIYYVVFILSILPLFCVRISAPSIVGQIVGFTGISYMCFKIWQMLFEIHDGKITSIKLIDAVGFLVFFPSFSSGPIARYQAFADNYNKKIDSFLEEYFSPGLRKLLLGIFYKFVLAYLVNTYFLSRISDERTFVNVILYMYAYTLYLFFDFAGYSNMAIGTGCLMGIKLPENFNKPFLACNMKEFWDRWHMSLSKWFTDYVYGRFVLNSVRNGFFKNVKVASRWASVFTMVTMGLWHGFSMHYVIYGLYQGILLLITDILIKCPFYRNFKKKKYFKPISRVVCFQFIAFGMLLFSGHFFFK